MQPDPEHLRQHYASLSDEALLEVDRTDLVEAARMIFDLEVARRKLVLLQETRQGESDTLDEQADDDEAKVAEAHGAGEEPGWLGEAAEVYSWTVQSATAHAPDAGLDARDALEADGIPCQLDLFEMP